MSPVSGITAILCILIILVRTSYDALRAFFAFTMPKWIVVLFERYRVTISAGIVALIIVLTLSAGAALFVRAIGDNNNITYIHSLIPTPACVPLPAQNQSINTIVLRLDDVQANAWSAISMRMMEDAFTKSYPVVAGVIPHGISEDKTLTRFLRQHECHVQLAMHGYTHEASEYENAEGEFATLDEETATVKIVGALGELAKISDADITTFIPPQNQISLKARSALKAQGISIVSSLGSETYDLDTSTWNFETGDFVSPEMVMSQCYDRFAHGDTSCVIMLHPQDYANDDGSLNAERYASYLKLLEYIAVSDTRVATFDELEAEKAKRESIFTRQLSVGDSGEDVRILQKYLNQLQYTVTVYGTGSTGQESDLFWLFTEDALKRYQEDNALPPTGVLDSKTALKLQSHIEALQGDKMF